MLIILPIINLLVYYYDLFIFAFESIKSAP
jgi:hypothetical protein